MTTTDRSVGAACRTRLLQAAREAYGEAAVRVVEEEHYVELHVEERLLCAAWSATAPWSLLENFLEAVGLPWRLLERDPVEVAKELLGQWADPNDALQILRVAE